MEDKFNLADITAPETEAAVNAESEQLLPGKLKVFQIFDIGSLHLRFKTGTSFAFSLQLIYTIADEKF